MTWDVYLDQIAAVGYLHTELGPQGFMPQDPAQLEDELAKVSLQEYGVNLVFHPHADTHVDAQERITWTG